MTQTNVIHLIPIEQLDLAQCVVGPDLIADMSGDTVTLYRHYGRTAELVGRFDTPAEALALLDETDLPEPPVSGRLEEARTAAGRRAAYRVAA